MKRRLAVLAILAFVLIGAVTQFVGTSSPFWNHLVAQALTDRGSYIAEVVTHARYCGRDINTRARVFHSGPVEKIEYNGATGISVWSISTGGHTYTYLPKTRKLLVSDASSTLLENDRRKLIAANYRASSAGEGKVAGRDVYIVRLAPRRGGRGRKRLWIDKQTHTVLRSEDYSSQGARLGRMEVTAIDYGAKIDKREFSLPKQKSVKIVDVCKPANASAMRRSLGFAARTPRYIPAGYKFEGYHLFNSQCNCGHLSAQLTYTDGLNVVSVFESPLMVSCGSASCNMPCCTKGCVMGGCEMAVTGRVSRSNKTVVVVADLMPDQIRKIAESVD